MAKCKQELEKTANLYEFRKNRIMMSIKPGFFEGINRIFNHQKLYSNYRIMVASSSTDYVSILSDWKNVGLDLNGAIKDYERSSLGE
jgi:hypothetical protein